MATTRLVNGGYTELNFTGTRLINGVWLVGQPESAPPATGGPVPGSLGLMGVGLSLASLSVIIDILLRQFREIL